MISEEFLYLFVDESPALANLICMYLQKNGEMTVDTSQSVDDAMNKLRYISYDVIISDYNLTDENGNTLLRSVRAQGERVPFVYFVAFRDSEFENEARHFGQVSFIEKMGSSARIWQNFARQFLIRFMNSGSMPLHVQNNLP